MVYKVNVTISPANLTDLYVINDNLPIRIVKRLSDYEVSGNVLTGSVEARQTTDTIRIISSGYVEQVLTFSEIQTNPDIVLVSSNEVENLSNGTNTYPIADKTARSIIDSLDDVAFNGVRVDQTYDSASTSPQSGTAVAEAISDLANQDLSNLTSQGKNIANWSNNVTNCITEIPQDIKLELNNGTLTLKAGSVTHYANGTTLSINSDVSFLFTTSTFNELIIVYDSGTLGAYIQGTNAISAASAPTPPYADCIWFDTTNSKLMVTHNTGGTWTEIPLPLGVASCVTGVGFTSIDQVFNGFGYIGSTDFILPNVKCIETLGKNPDGSYITRVFTNTEVRIVTLDSSISGNYWVGFNTLIDGSFDYFGTYLNENVISETQPSYNNVTWFNPLDGKWNYVNNGLAQLGGAWQYAIKTVSAGKITNWKPINSTFKALNYWDKPTISGWSMPSSRYINLTLLASGSQYTAPANGWVWLDKSTTTAQFITLQNISAAGIRSSSVYYGVGMYLAVILPVKKGDVFMVEYNAEGTLNAFKFIYAEGEN